MSHALIRSPLRRDRACLGGGQIVLGKYDAFVTKVTQQLQTKVAAFLSCKVRPCTMHHIMPCHTHTIPYKHDHISFCRALFMCHYPLVTWRLC